MAARPSIRPIGPGAIGESLTALLDEMRTAIMDLQSPQSPVQLPSLAFADLPPADDWRECAVSVTDKNCIAISTSVASVYTWLRADGSAI